MSKTAAGHDQPEAREAALRLRVEEALGGLRPALLRLDRLLEGAVRSAQAVYGAEAAADPYRGLHIAPGDVERLLARQFGVPLLREDTAELSLVEGLAEGSRLCRLGRLFGLSSFDREIIVVALAPELDQRYERLYAYLQDDVTRRRPSVDLMLNLLCTSPMDKLARRAHLAGGAPLLRHGLVSLVGDPQQLQPSLLAQSIKLDEQVVAHLIGSGIADVRPEDSGGSIDQRPVSVDTLPIADGTRQALRLVIEEARRDGRPPRIYLQGRQGIGKRRCAEAVAAELGTGFLAADTASLPAGPTDWEAAVVGLLRTALLNDTTLYLAGVDRLLGSDGFRQREVLLARLEGHRGPVILGGSLAWTPRPEPATGFEVVELPPLDDRERLACVQVELAAAGVSLPEADVQALAGRFRLTPEQIAATVRAGARQSRRRSVVPPGGRASQADRGEPRLADFLASAREQSGHMLADLARQISPRYRWEDIVLPEDQSAHLREICAQARNRHIVHGRWGFGRTLARGKGLNVLFSGPPGTGKTMAADVLANDLYLPLYQIDLSQVVSKYIGETEKNLERIFAAAESANAILFFDEADALFGKRSEVRDAHDRYANIEVGYLLQKMEEYEGVAILATNLRSHMDEAFVRRMQAIVEFPFPDEAHRRRIWESLFPVEAPLADDVDFAVLAREVKLAGGNIRNIGLAASFFAAAEGGQIAMAHLLRAARREHQKLGRTWNELAVGSGANTAS